MCIRDRYSAEPAPAKKIKPSGSEFLKAVGNVAQDRAWEVMDELMDTLKIHCRMVLFSWPDVYKRQML